VVGVTGNFKFDATPDPLKTAQGISWRKTSAKPVVMFASSREGEEAELLQSFKRFRSLALVKYERFATNNVVNEVQWLIVPRHPQRFEAVVQLCQEQGFSVSRRSDWANNPEPADIWLGDSLGEMALYYALSDVALLGGSFAPLGGQNLIEAAACGCPVVMGPNTFNFAQAAQVAAAAGAAFEVQTLEQAVEKVLELLRSETALHQAANAARSLSHAHRGAAERTALAVRELLRASASPQSS
jgi:3-deoxy-D-manno-octulosonic-acid transferase